MLELGLRRGAFQAQLGEFLADADIEDPREWTRRIVLDRACWKFAFHRWEFEESNDDQAHVFIGGVSVELPKVGEDPSDAKLQELKAEEKILVVGKGGLRKFNVSFRADPHPSRVDGLARFVAQVISKENGPVGLARSKKAWSSPRLTATIDFNNLRKVDWEEGWHFVRILAQTEDGELIPLVDEAGHPLPWAVQEEDAAILRPNESDLFYVFTEVDEPPPPPQRAVQNDNSLEHARLRLQFSAVVDGRRREAALVAPTHPLRALWFVSWAETGARWLEGARKGPAEFVVATRDALLRQLAPVGHPPVLATPGGPSVSGRLMTPIDNLAPHWTLYAPSHEPDPRGLLGEVCAAFGLPEPGIGGAVIDGEALATRVQRYLVQHPYVSTLIINAFNPGRAGVLAEMLLALQRQPVFEDIRYDVRLIVPDADAPGVGEGLAELLSPSGSLTGREADAFATLSGDHAHH